MTIPYPGIDYQNQPLVDAWWTPGWTNQNQSYIPAPSTGQFKELGFPPGLTYLSVIGNYFDFDGNPLSGFLTFWPSSALTISVSGGTAYLPQRFVGTNLSMLGLNQFGSGKVYLWNGQLAVNLLATNNANQTPAAFTYHVKEHFLEGNEYDINLPVTTTSPANIHSLIIPGSVIPPFSNAPAIPNITVNQAAVATQEVTANVSNSITLPGSPLTDVVQFAFKQTGEPQTSDWINGSWVTSSYPFVAQVLVGPNGAISLTQGTYVIWVQVIATPQILPVPVGYLVIF